MDIVPKSRSRRAEIRKNRPDAARPDWQELKAAGIPGALAIAAAFFVVTAAILMLRQDVIPYRVEQPIQHDIVSRVGFPYMDKLKLVEEQRRAADREPRVYAPASNTADAFDGIEKALLVLPEHVANAGAEPPADLQEKLGLLDAGTLTAFRLAAAGDGAKAYAKSVDLFVKALRDYRTASNLPLIILPDAELLDDVKARRDIRIGTEVINANRVYSVGQKEELRAILRPLAEVFSSRLQPKVVEFTLAELQPTHRLDDGATVERRNAASAAVPASAGQRRIEPNQILVRFTKNKTISQDDWLLLRAENDAYLNNVPGANWKPKIGLICLCFIVTMVLAGYVAHYQPRVVKNHVRAVAIAGLLVSMLLLAALAGIGNGPIYLFGVAPTLLVAMILTIAYDKRFSIGIASMHGILAAIVLNQGIAFFVILWAGVLTASFLLDDIRTRSKLIEVGGVTALAMIFAAAGAGLLALESYHFILRNCLYAGAAGLAVGFIVLGILPFVERAFKITTSMTLLELADVSQPLLRRLAMEAPGTYSHSQQVATLSEAAAEAIGANSLLCRVGSYYHDVGKINKADYFIENQTCGDNRHLNLTPSVSYYIITGHVKDGVELAKEYNLPPSLLPFIQQHHGTTLVEYFYRQACAQQTQREPGGPAIADHEYRYPGPKPRSKEVACVMLADAVESATRAMTEPTASRVETLVHDLALKRLLDGQFDECDLTMRDLDRMERSMVKTLMSIYHGRIAYPSTAAVTNAPPAGTATTPTYAAARTA